MRPVFLCVRSVYGLPVELLARTQRLDRFDLSRVHRETVIDRSLDWAIAWSSLRVVTRDDFNLLGFAVRPHPLWDAVLKSLDVCEQLPLRPRWQEPNVENFLLTNTDRFLWEVDPDVIRIELPRAAFLQLVVLSLHGGSID